MQCALYRIVKKLTQERRTNCLYQGKIPKLKKVLIKKIIEKIIPNSIIRKQKLVFRKREKKIKKNEKNDNFPLQDVNQTFLFVSFTFKRLLDRELAN